MQRSSKYCRPKFYRKLNMMLAKFTHRSKHCQRERLLTWNRAVELGQSLKTRKIQLNKPVFYLKTYLSDLIKNQFD